MYLREKGNRKRDPCACTRCGHETNVYERERKQNGKPYNMLCNSSTRVTDLSFHKTNAYERERNNKHNNYSSERFVASLSVRTAVQVLLIASDGFVAP